MSKYLTSTAFAAALALSAVLPAHADPVDAGADLSSMTIRVSGGCGPNGWRGPWGHCRNTPYYGPLPGGYYQPKPAGWNGCPPGYWHGPYGHCRNTPFHGRLPNGSWT